MGHCPQLCKNWNVFFPLLQADAEMPICQTEGLWNKQNKHRSHNLVFLICWSKGCSTSQVGWVCVMLREATITFVHFVEENPIATPPRTYAQHMTLALLWVSIISVVKSAERDRSIDGSLLSQRRDRKSCNIVQQLLAAQDWLHWKYTCFCIDPNVLQFTGTSTVPHILDLSVL